MAPNTLSQPSSLTRSAGHWMRCRSRDWSSSDRSGIHHDAARLRNVVAAEHFRARLEFRRTNEREQHLQWRLERIAASCDEVHSFAGERNERETVGARRGFDAESG